MGERRDRVFKRLRAGGVAGSPGPAASPPAAPSAVEGPLGVHPPVDFCEIVESAGEHLKALQSGSQGRSPAVTADPALICQLTAAAACAEAQAGMVGDCISTLNSLKDPQKVRASLEDAQREAAAATAAADCLLAQAAAAHEKGSVVLGTAFKLQTQEVHELAAAVAASFQTTREALSAAAAAAAAGLLRQLADRHETRRAEIASRLQENRFTEAELRDKRAARLEEHRSGLAAAARRDHAAHAALTAQLSQQVTDHALKLVAAKRDAILAAEGLNYNCRVLGESAVPRPSFFHSR